MSLSKRVAVVVLCLVALTLVASVAVASGVKLLPVGDEPGASGSGTLTIQLKSYPGWGGPTYNYVVTLKLKCTGLRPGQTYRAGTYGTADSEGVADAKGGLVISASGEYPASWGPPSKWVGVGRRDPEGWVTVLLGQAK